MTAQRKIRIAMEYASWTRLAEAAEEAARREGDGYLFGLAAGLYRSVGHSAVAMSLEAEAERLGDPSARDKQPAGD